MNQNNDDYDDYSALDAPDHFMYATKKSQWSFCVSFVGLGLKWLVFILDGMLEKTGCAQNQLEARERGNDLVFYLLFSERHLNEKKR